MRRQLGLSIALLLFLTGLALGQTKKWTPSRTPDGQPDLQGFWTNNSYVPLERTLNDTKKLYTREEAIETEKKAAAQEAEQTLTDTVDDVHYDFSQFGLDRSQTARPPILRTSLIVDPSDGKRPP